MELVKANKTMARELACFINMAGEGIPVYLWSQMIEGSETAMDVGEARAQREEGGFSYKNAKVLMNDGAILGMVISYQLPLPYEVGDLDDYSPVVRPLLALESIAAGSFYINALATHERYRRKGVASALMVAAESLALEHRCHDMSLIVASENSAAISMYEKIGFFPLQAQKIVDYPGAKYGGDWVLMIKHLV